MVLCAIEATTRHASAEVRINDIPAAVIGHPTGTGSGYIPIPAFVVAGRNEIAARLIAVPPGGEEPPFVELRAAVFQEGDIYFTGAGRELARIDWTGPGPEAVLRQTFVADFGPAEWSWSRCQRWPDPAAALADAGAFVSDLARAYYASDAGWLEAASGPKFDDMARAFTNVSGPEIRAQTAALIAASPAQPVPQTAPPQPRLCCEGRLLMLTGTDGRPWLRKPRPGQPETAAQILIGKLDGRWQVIR